MLLSQKFLVLFLVANFTTSPTLSANSISADPSIHQDLLQLTQNSTLRSEPWKQPASEISAQKIFIRLNVPLNSDTSHDGDQFAATTLEPILATTGAVAIPQGAFIVGVLTHAGTWGVHYSGYQGASLEIRVDGIDSVETGLIPVAAQLVIHGGVTHVLRDESDLAIDCGTGSYAPYTILVPKKRKIIDLRPGDKLKLEFPDGIPSQELERSKSKMRQLKHRFGDNVDRSNSFLRL